LVFVLATTTVVEKENFVQNPYLDIVQ